MRGQLIATQSGENLLVRGQELFVHDFLLSVSVLALELFQTTNSVLGLVSLCLLQSLLHLGIETLTLLLHLLNRHRGLAGRVGADRLCGN